MFSMIAAVGGNGVIGKNNALMWSLPEDMRHFKAYTKGKAVLMGHQTALSIGRALPGRLNLVLTRGGKAPYEGQIAIPSVEAVHAWHIAHGSCEIVVIGGGQVYEALLPHVEKASITWVMDRPGDGDTFFHGAVAFKNAVKWKAQSLAYIAADPATQRPSFNIMSYTRMEHSL